MISQEIIDLYDEYTHQPLSRHEFLQRLAQIAGGAAAAALLLPLLEPRYIPLAPTDSDKIFTEYGHYTGVNGQMQAYIARPKAKKAYPTVIVIHENRGLTPHIEDVARRVAQAGFLAVAPNALSPLGTQPADEDEARQLFTTLAAEDNLQNFLRAFDYIATRKDSNQSIGCVGFCWGGLMANTLATKVPTLKAAIGFYGRQPALEAVPNIRAAIQLHYASLDTRVNEGAAAYEEALKAAHIEHEIYWYENAQHAFHNDTSVARYDASAAQLAWQRSIAFFQKHL
ncbi:dienelactone hydrolase family protein [Eisenibacter elegans]|jgi:carboxymethylenebutenolidase|uniref:dienelactone hydrolase family protein n=1 Tax=Eisenibacter elegans TaxID=997 RepID=UPI0003FC32E4|nr:dienelactone hydrolase family protein [Eisenibacter elegans]